MRLRYKANDFSLAATFKVSLSVERRIQVLCSLGFPEESNTLFLEDFARSLSPSKRGNYIELCVKVVSQVECFYFAISPGQVLKDQRLDR